jgi:hypothetical protein
MPHTYKHGKLIYPSVTTIIGDCLNKAGALNQWAANSAVGSVKDHWEEMQGMGIGECLNAARFDYKRLSREALDIGSEFHNIAEHALKCPGMFIEADRNVDINILDNCVDAFESWRENNEIDVIETERTVLGEHWGGTLDLECDLNGIHTIVDYKTSKAFYMDSMLPQLAAYWSVTDAEEAGILRVDKETGEYEYKRLKKKQLEKGLRIFNAMLNLYLIRHPIIAKRAGVPF